MARKETDWFRQNVGELCKQRGEIQRIADKAGITRIYLSRVIHGGAVPSMDIAAKIAEALGFQLSELLQNPNDFSKSLAKSA